MSERARILYLTVNGDLSGGAVIQYRYLIERLLRARYEPLVFTRSRGELNTTLTREGIQNEVFQCPLWTYGELLRWGPRLWRARRQACERLTALARARMPGLLHGDSMVAPYLLAVSSALGIPAVVHVRGSLDRYWIERLGLKRATALVAIGEGYREELLEAGISREKISVIPDATDLGRFRPGGSLLRHENPSIAANEVLFGIVGPITAIKHQYEFLEAAEQVIAQGRRVRVFVIGAPNPHRPWYAGRVRRFAAARRFDHLVTFTGHRDDMARVMPSLDVLVTLSGGSVMLEAMASGIPVITASARDPERLTIVRDGESGRVVPAGDGASLVRAMLELCDDADERRRLGANGRQRAEALFNADRLAMDTAALYESILAAKPPEPRSNAKAGDC